MIRRNQRSRAATIVDLNTGHAASSTNKFVGKNHIGYLYPFQTLSLINVELSALVRQRVDRKCHRR
jgi:hypothetical protein